jgi:hypothetical protein
LTEYAYLLVELKGKRVYLFLSPKTTGNLALMLKISSIGWKNFINPDYEASPVVGISRKVIVFNFSSH